MVNWFRNVNHLISQDIALSSEFQAQVEQALFRRQLNTKTLQNCFILGGQISLFAKPLQTSFPPIRTELLVSLVCARVINYALYSPVHGDLNDWCAGAGALYCPVIYRQLTKLRSSHLLFSTNCRWWKQRWNHRIFFFKFPGLQTFWFSLKLI